MRFALFQSWITSIVDVWQIFGYLNLLLATVFLLFAGFRRGWDHARWTLLVTAFVFGTGLGSMLIPSIMGALLGGAACFLTVKRLIRFSPSAADLFVLYMIGVIAVGRLGCLFSGCCFGTPTDLPWGINYNTGNLAHWLHFHAGQQAYFYDPSLAVHPVQLYETLALLFIALPASLYGMRRRIAPQLIFSGFLAFYFLLRFALEFVRGMSNVWWSEVMVGRISLFQIFLLTAAFLILIQGYFSRKGSWAGKLGEGRSINFQAWVLAGMLLASLMLSTHFQRVQLVMLALLIPINCYFIFSQVSLGIRKSNPISLSWGSAFTVLLLLSSQGFLEQNTNTSTPILKKTCWLYGIDQGSDKLVRLGDARLSFDDYRRRKELLQDIGDTTSIDSTFYQKAMSDLKEPKLVYSIGGSFSSVEFEHETCGGKPVTERVISRSLMATMDRERTRTERISSYINGRLELTEGSIRSSDNDTSKFAYATSFINGGLDGELLGAGLGVGLALVRGLDEDILPLFPAGYLRLGPREFHIEAGVNDRYYQRPGFLNTHLSLGHKPTRGPGYQLGVGNRGPYLLLSTGYFFTATNLRIGNLFQADLTLSVMGPELDGFGTTVLIRLPGK